MECSKLGGHWKVKEKPFSPLPFSPNNLVAHLNVTNPSHLHCQFDFDWRFNLFSFAWNYGVAHGHILRVASHTSEWRTASRVVSRSYPNTTSSRWRTRTSRSACSSWSRTSSSLVLSYFSELPHPGDLATSRPRFWWGTRDRLWRLLRNWRYFYLHMVLSSQSWSLSLVARSDSSTTSQ